MRRSSAAEKHIPEALVEPPAAEKAPRQQSERELEEEIARELREKSENETGAQVINFEEGARRVREAAAGNLTVEEEGESAAIVSEAKSLQRQEKADLGKNGSESSAGESEASQLKSQLAEAGRELAKFERFASKSETNAEAVAEELAAAREKYKALRFEYVGESIALLAETKEQQIEEKRLALESDKGFFRKVYDAHKKLGELNIAKLSDRLGMKFPTSRAGKIIANVASLRTLVSLGLVGVAAWGGAGAAVGIAAIAGRRVLSGMGTAIGTYDFLRASHEGRMAAGFSAEQFDNMSLGEVAERMEQIEANALIGGKGLKDHKTYQKLKGRYVRMATEEQEKLKTAGNWDKEQIRTVAENAEMTLQNQVRKEERGNVKRKIIAAAAGTVVGSGLLAKVFGNFTQWLRGGSAHESARAAGDAMRQGAEVPTAESAPQAAPAAETGTVPSELGNAETSEGGNAAAPELSAPAAEAPPAALDPDHVDFRMTADGNVEVVNAPPAETMSEKMLAASEVHKGDGYAKVIQRDLAAEPEKFGYDPDRDGKVATWARKTAGEVMRKNGILSAGREMRFSIVPGSGETPRVALKMVNGEIAIEKSGIKDYVYEKPPAATVEVAEAPKAVEPQVVEQAKPGAPVAVETETLRAEGNYDVTGSHLKGEEFELGHVEHEFKPLTPEQAKQAEALLAKDYESHLMRGSVKNPELVKHLVADRKDKLFALKEGYEAALKQGKVDLARRLHGDYNVLAAATNREIADSEVFKKLPRFKAPAVEAGVEHTEHKGTVVRGSSVRLEKPAPIEPPKFEAADNTAPIKGAKAMKKAVSSASEALTQGGEVKDPVFTRDANGKIIGMELETGEWNMKEIAVAESDLKPDWYETAVQNYQGSGNFSQANLLSETRKYYAYQKALAKMLHEGAYRPEEEKYLEKKVVALQSKIVKKYGNIFKKLEA